MKHAPRIAAIHDISGLGRCSMAVVMPVLSAMGGQCCPLPTAWLSAHTGFPPSDRAVFHDMTDPMAAAIGHWQELGAEFDAVYSGFLGSARQVEVVEAFHAAFRRPQTLVVVDPVLGDHGRPYRTCTPELCRRMEELARGADLITPNLTEAALLLGEDCASLPDSEAGARAWLERLSLGGRRSVVLTGLSFRAGQVGAGCLEAAGGQVSFAMARQEPARFPGTGDLFTAVALGALLRGEELPAAVERAVGFVQRCAARTLALGTPPRDGVQFEPLLGELI